MVILDQIAAAMNTMQKKKKMTANNDDEIPVVEADDLMDDWPFKRHYRLQ